jgi:ribokinase
VSVRDRGRVVVLGDITLDVVATCAAPPLVGQCVRPYGLTVSGGGSAANTALALARLGYPVTLLGTVGSDALAGAALAALDAVGVDLDHVQRTTTAPTGLVYGIVSDDQVRTTIAYQGAAATYSLNERAVAVVAGARALHVSGYAMLAEPMRTAAHTAIAVAGRHGVAVSLDPCVTGPESAVAEMRGLLPDLAVLTPNRAEALRLAQKATVEEAISALCASCSGLVAVKDGAAGCFLARAGDVVRVPGFVVHVIDPTGAGDAFDAALLAGSLDGLALEVIAVVANAAGALVATRTGAQTSGDAGELIAFLDVAGPLRLTEAVAKAKQWLSLIAMGGLPRSGSA